ncbi:MAG TPA: dephospho-CoA kinase [Ktedonobacterales bacterium]|nr:dephospho-CoA kinase [Ktedonobacterales bacterium]
MPYILGLTGNIASGKTTVGLTLLELGATTYVDADQAVHELYLPGQPLAARLAQEFGPGVLNAEGGVDRARLGELVFGNAEQLKRLEALVHPAVQAALVGRLRALGPEDVGVLDAVKLVEAGYAPFCRGVWVVTCPEAVQLQRLIETRGLTEAQARARLSAQPALQPKLAVATEVIHNDGSLDALRAQITAAWQRFRQGIGGAG